MVHTVGYVLLLTVPDAVNPVPVAIDIVHVLVNTIPFVVDIVPVVVDTLHAVVNTVPVVVNTVLVVVNIVPVVVDTVSVVPPKGGRGCLMSPPCLESQGCHLIPLCYLLSCSSA